MVLGYGQAWRSVRQPKANLFALIFPVAFDAPARTRPEPAGRLRQEPKDLHEELAPDARAILNELPEKYAEHGTAQFVIPDVLKVPPFPGPGNAPGIANPFTGPAQLREAVNVLQTLLYAA